MHLGIQPLDQLSQVKKCRRVFDNFFCVKFIDDLTKRHATFNDESFIFAMIRIWRIEIHDDRNHANQVKEYRD